MPLWDEAGGALEERSHLALWGGRSGRSVSPPLRLLLVGGVERGLLQALLPLLPLLAGMTMRWPPSSRCRRC